MTQRKDRKPSYWAVVDWLKDVAGRFSGSRGWSGDRVPRGEKEIAALLAQRPIGWEYLALAGILLAERDKVESHYRDHLLGFAEPSSEAIPDEDVPTWVAGHLAGVSRSIELLTSLMTAEAQARALGKPGEPGDAQMIWHLVERWNGEYRRMMERVARLRGAIVSDEYKEAVDAAADMLTAPIEQYRAFVDEVVRKMDALPAWLRSPKEKREPLEITITLQLTTDKAAEERSNAAIRRLKEKLGFGREVEVRMLSGGPRSGLAKGNNAVWNCVCWRLLPLFGRSGLAAGPTSDFIVQCPRCSRSYFVVPDGGDCEQVLRVEEISSPH